MGGGPRQALQRLWLRRGTAPAWPLAAVLLAHAWALGLWPAAPAPRHAQAPAVQLRTIVLAPALPAAPMVPIAPAAPVGGTAPSGSTHSEPGMALPPHALLPPAESGSSGTPPVPTLPPDPLMPAVAASAVPLASTAAAATLRQPSDAERRLAAQTDADGEPLPLYATRLPGPALLHYTLRFGALDGEAVLHWRPQGERYELHLEARAFGRPVIEQASSGALADVGVAPERFTDRRRGRGGQAANFQREGGRVTFSGARVDMLLPPGAQDRLSVLVQLAAVAGAWPQAPALGEAIVLWVVDARGYAGTWKFVVEAEEALNLPIGPVQALRLKREPRHDQDPGMTVWLDPTRQWWPVRLRQGRLRGDFVYELQLSAIERER